MANQKKADNEQKTNSVLRPEYILLIAAVVYLLYTICTPVMRKHPRVTTVEPGEIVSNHYYTGIRLRQRRAAAIRFTICRRGNAPPSAIAFMRSPQPM